MKKKINNWTKHQKEKIILDIQRIGVVAGCRKHGLYKTTYYTWLDKYNAHGIEGLEPCPLNCSAPCTLNPEPCPLNL